MLRTLGIAVLVAGLAAMIVAGVWSWRKLWRSADSAYDRIVYTYGVKGMGGSFLVLMSILSAVKEEDNFMSVGQRALMTVVVYFPLSPWMGYWFGRSMANFWGVSNDR